ncbi:hypothetical protein ACR6C2_13555 [Streptomyces sp. INA 01156]
MPQLRLALNQIDSRVGDLAGNAEAIVRWTGTPPNREPTSWRSRRWR